MRTRLAIRGLSGLSARLSARHLPPVAAAAAARAADTLAGEITAETGAPAVITGDAARPVVRVADAGLLDRLRGSFERPGEPVLDRIRLTVSRLLAGRRRRR
ncbi:hypothetical protein ACI7BZ_20065 [Xanthobacter sp. AM11]|uniref:hypothetical protein n=1 Tax=Xanthobacter sp. AM11 TaxID=3380643 RepID=UPI0039BEE92B